MKVITTKVNKATGLLQKLQKTLLRLVLITMNKALVRPHLDYGDMIYDETYNERSSLSGAIRGSSREKLYHELGLNSSQHCIF